MWARMQERRITVEDLAPFRAWREGEGRVPPNSRWHVNIRGGAICGYGGGLLTMLDHHMVPKQSLHIPIQQANGRIASTKTWYHGSKIRFDQFKTVSKAGVSEEVAEQPIFLTPSLEFARLHAGFHGWVYTVKADVSKTFRGSDMVHWDRRYFMDPAEGTALGKEVFAAIENNEIWPDGDKEAEGYYSALAAMNWDATQSPEFGRWLKSKGYDSFLEVGEGVENMGVFDPSKLEIVSVEPAENTQKKDILTTAAAPKGGVYYHGGPDIPDNVLRRGYSGAIFFTKSREYATQYMKRTETPGVLYEVVLNFKGKHIFDPENPSDIRQLKDGFLALVNDEEYATAEDALRDYARVIQSDLLDWATGSQSMEAVEAAGFHGMRFRERPSSLHRKPTGGYEISGSPIESVALFDREVPVRRADPQPFAAGKSGAAAAEPPVESITDTAAFNSWFGDSKVVDAEGQPLRVVHGTDSEFDTFDRAKSTSGPSKFGFWFTSDTNLSELFGPIQMEVYLCIRKPYTITSGRWNDIRSEHAKDTAWFERWRDNLIGKGYDGLIVKGETFITSRGWDMSDPSVYAVFRANQIKSVKNSGTFDANQDSITAAARPLTDTPAFKRWFAGSKIIDAAGHPLMMYHGTKTHFSKVDMGQGAQGVFWLTSDEGALQRGEVGAASSKTVLRCYVSMKNPAGWEEYEKFSLGELKNKGYDGVMLDDPDGKFDVIVFKPNQVKILPPEETQRKAAADGLLYHGTALSNAEEIWSHGLLPGSDDSVWVSTSLREAKTYARTAMRSANNRVTHAPGDRYAVVVLDRSQCGELYENYGSRNFFSEHAIPASAIIRIDTFDAETDALEQTQKIATETPSVVYHVTAAAKKENVPAAATKTEAPSGPVSGEDVLQYLMKLNRWSKVTALQVLGVDGYGSYYTLRSFPLSRLKAGDDYNPALSKQYSELDTPFPPIILGEEWNWVTRKAKLVIKDGNNRVDAAKRRGDKTIQAYVPIDDAKTAFKIKDGTAQAEHVRDRHVDGQKAAAIGPVDVSDVAEGLDSWIQSTMTNRSKAYDPYTLLIRTMWSYGIDLNEIERSVPEDSPLKAYITTGLYNANPRVPTWHITLEFAQGFRAALKDRKHRSRPELKALKAQMLTLITHERVHAQQHQRREKDEEVRGYADPTATLAEEHLFYLARPQEIGAYAVHAVYELRESGWMDAEIATALRSFRSPDVRKRLGESSVAFLKYSNLDEYLERSRETPGAVASKYLAMDIFRRFVQRMVQYLEQKSGSETSPEVSVSGSEVADTTGLPLPVEGKAAAAGRQITRDEAIKLLTDSNARGKNRGSDDLDDFRYLQSGPYVVVAMPLTDLDYIQQDMDRQEFYAAVPGKFPPVLAVFGPRVLRNHLEEGEPLKANVTNGNHRCCAAELRGDQTISVIMKLSQYELFEQAKHGPEPSAKRATAHATPEAIEAEAEAWEDAIYAPSEVGGGPANKYTWTQVDNFPVSKLPGTRDEWVQWFREEKEMAAAADGRDGYYEAMESWWSTDPNEPLFVTEGTDGKYYVWEGTHRTAIAKIHNMATVPVFLGTPKVRVQASASTKILYGTVQAELPEDSDAFLAVERAREEIDESDLDGTGLRTGPTHITVRYGIQTDDTGAIETYLRSLAPMEATLGSTEAFPPSASSDNAAVIIAPVVCPDLFRVNEQLANEGDFIPPTFDYKPHVTVAYVKSEATGKYVGLKMTEGQKFTILEVTVVTKSKEKKVIALSGESKQAARSLGQIFAIAMTETLSLDDPAKFKYFNLTEQSKVKPMMKALKAGEELPPILVVQHRNGQYLVLDGNHRLMAALKSNMTEIEAYVVMWADLKKVLNAYFGGQIPTEASDLDDYILLDEDRLEPYSKRAAKKQASSDLIPDLLNEFMPILQPGLPTPKIKIVNSIARYLGSCLWNYGLRGGVPFSDENTVIELQKSIISNEETLRRVLAHELCHHEDDLVTEAAQLQALGFPAFQREMKFDRTKGHGPSWQAIAARFNAKYGADFVTKTSDESYEKAANDIEFFVLLSRLHSTDKLYYSWAVRPSPKQKAVIEKEVADGAKLIKTTDAAYMKGRKIGLGWSYKANPEDAAKMEALFAGEGKTASAMLTVYHVSSQKDWKLDLNHNPQTGGIGAFYVTTQPEVWQETLHRRYVHAFEIPTDVIAHSPKDYPSRDELVAWAVKQGYMSMQVVKRPSGEVVTEWGSDEPMIRPELAEKAKTLPLYGTKDPMRGGGLTFLEYAFLKDDGFSAVESYYSPDGQEIAVFDTSCLKPVKTAAKAYSLPPAPVDPQTQTPAFKAWFAGSKVVDRDGHPLKVYHGMPDARFLKDTGVFQSWTERYREGTEDPNRAFFFAGDHATAASYADDHRAFDYQNAEPGVFTAYLCLKNPLIVHNGGVRWKRTDECVARAKAGGHDGVIIYKTIDDYTVKGKKVTDVYVAFHPQQIKAAEGNGGDFDPTSKHVYATRKMASAAVALDPSFRSWFAGSKVVNADGTPKPVYHGTGADIQHFSYDFTGHGNDQLGSGFYFTDLPDTASDYTTRQLNDQPKPGGEQPNVVQAYLALKNPIIVGETHSTFTAVQIQKILSVAPDLETKLNDFGDVEAEGKNKVLRDAVKLYMDAQEPEKPLHLLNMLANDFYREDVKAFNEAVKNVTGYDGVISPVGATDETHYVAWFPSQIRSAISGLSFEKEASGPRVKTPVDLVYHNTKSQYLDDIKREGLDAGSFASRPIDFGGDVWLAVSKADLPNYQEHQYGAATALEPAWEYTKYPAVYDDVQKKEVEDLSADGELARHNVPADKIFVVTKRGRVIAKLSDYDVATSTS